MAEHQIIRLETSQDIWGPRLATNRAPAGTDGLLFQTTKLRQVGFTEYDCARIEKSLGNRGVTPCDCAYQSMCAACGVHAQGAVCDDGILDNETSVIPSAAAQHNGTYFQHNGNTMNRTPYSPSSALIVELLRNGEDIVAWCCRDEGVQTHALKIVCVDVGEVALDQLDAGQGSIM